jgi:hypothetical protein
VCAVRACVWLAVVCLTGRCVSGCVCVCMFMDARRVSAVTVAVATALVAPAACIFLHRTIAAAAANLSAHQLILHSNGKFDKAYQALIPYTCFMVETVRPSELRLRRRAASPPPVSAARFA